MSGDHNSDGERLLSGQQGEAAFQARRWHLDESSDERRFKSNCHRLYLSHALSTWNSRIFEFGAFLFLASIFPNTLLPASVYALARSAAAAILSPWLGGYIDGSERLKVIRLSILGQRLPVALSCGCFLVLLSYPAFHSSVSGAAVSLLMLSVLACIEKLSAVANTISIERDWVIELAQDDGKRLALLNSRMRRIDLFCKLIGPLAISFVDTYSTFWAVVATGMMSSLSSAIEYIAIARVYRTVPALQSYKEGPAEGPAEPPARLPQALTNALPDWSRYIMHRAFLPSLSLALLCLTVLSFNGQLITYLISLELSSATIAVARAIAAMFELTATWLGPLLTTRIGAIRSGIWFLNLQLVFIIIACGCLWLPVTNNSYLPITFGLVASVILSRTGLWGFDLSAQLIIQDEVEPELRGTFSALEFSLQNIFEMLAFGSTIVFPKPEHFKYPALISAVAVAMASALYAYFVRRRRGHLLHACACLDTRNSIKHRRDGWREVDGEADDATELDDR